MVTELSSFIFDGYEEKFQDGRVSFFYVLHHDGEVFHFTETIHVQPIVLTTEQREKIRPILDCLLLMLGISYWKLYCAKNIAIKPFSLSKQEADFWNTIYTKGLGEFYFKNNIDFRHLINFPFEEKVSNTSPSIFALKNRVLVQLGGGKDSIVSAELLKIYNKDFSLFVLNEEEVHKNVAGVIGKEVINVKRVIDVKLFELNMRSDIFNGHVPISAIYAFVGLLTSALYEYSYIITSNEESANYGNVFYRGEEINHQWSKSYEFEQLFQKYMNDYIATNIQYFSLLRPIRELKIVQLFTQYKQYFQKFSSCNTNFRIRHGSDTLLWCGSCPKCAFVFLSLSAFLPKNEVVKIFGKNLFSDGRLLSLFRELTGLLGFKPFECVGTPEESQYALYLVMKRGEYTDDEIVKQLSHELTFDQDTVMSLERNLSNVSEIHNIPREFGAVLQNI